MFGKFSNFFLFELSQAIIAEVVLKDVRSFLKKWSCTLSDHCPKLLHAKVFDSRVLQLFPMHYIGTTGKAVLWLHRTFQSSIFPAGNDYTAITSMELTFSNGSTGPQTVMISTTSDTVVENTETFTLSLTTDEMNVTIVPTSSVATVNIQDSSSKFRDHNYSQCERTR